MNKLEQDFLELKQKNDKISTELEETKQVLDDVISFICTEQIHYNREFEDILKELRDEFFNCNRLEFISSYSKISHKNSRKIVEFCVEKSNKFMKKFVLDKLNNE